VVVQDESRLDELVCTPLSYGERASVLVCWERMDGTALRGGANTGVVYDTAVADLDGEGAAADSKSIDTYSRITGVHSNSTSARRETADIGANRKSARA
jgi:hypothetical protein